MNIKIKNPEVKNKVLLGFWFVVFVAVIFLLNWLLRIPVLRTDEMLTKIADSDKQIIALYKIKAEFFLNYDKEDNQLFISNETIETESKAVINKLKENIQTFKKIGLSENNDLSLNDFTKSLYDYNTSFNNLILTIRERGTKNSGIIKNWLNQSEALRDSSLFYNTEITKEIKEIKNLESEYLLYRDINSLKNIAGGIEELRRLVSSEEGNTGSIDSYSILNNYLISIETRLGHNSEQGIIPELEKSSKNLSDTFLIFSNNIEKKATRVKIIWGIIKYVVIITITFLFIFLYIKSFSLFRPLKNISSFLKKLGQGELPSEKIDIGKHPELNMITGLLVKHVVSLNEKYVFINSLNHDTLNTNLKLAGDNDQIGKELLQLQKKIIESDTKQIKNEEENRVRQYINEGLAKFGDILRSKNNDIKSLGDAFMREIVKYLNAIQGGFFIFDDTDKGKPVLSLISAFAYNRKKYFEKSVELGEGLIGTCAKEKQYINLTDIPKGYISITSGLGDTPPNNLLLLPVLHENELLGVIEIASLNKFQKHEIDFSQQVAYSLGATLVNTRNNQRTAKLLTKSQQQAQEMAEQEEEMRQNMEELKATQEESSRREETFRGIAQAIERALMIIEYDLDGVISEANEKVLLFLGCDKNEIIGKSHKEVFKSNIHIDYDFLNGLQKVDLITLKESIKIGKKSFEITEHFSTVLNREGKVVKYINFIADGRTGNS